MRSLQIEPNIKVQRDVSLIDDIVVPTVRSVNLNMVNNGEKGKNIKGIWHDNEVQQYIKDKDITVQKEQLEQFGYMAQNAKSVGSLMWYAYNTIMLMDMGKAFGQTGEM